MSLTNLAFAIKKDKKKTKKGGRGRKHDAWEISKRHAIFRRKKSENNIVCTARPFFKIFTSNVLRLGSRSDNNSFSPSQSLIRVRERRNKYTRFRSFRVILRDNTGGGGSVTAPRGIRSISVETERNVVCGSSHGSSSSLVVDNDEDDEIDSGNDERLPKCVLRQEGGSLFEKNGNRGGRSGSA